ncbi:D-sedoheptulose-7-phosphate isomerase [Gryllotalpicola ginsengisoli]|uniref:D-sedoheptulose-7-phosphate isomerase n=1 Tax=Gryllotalpicola ginsengisoli TaxID=444608 RepID=UPI0003FEE9C3|nr:SIS domain-containing protein [Gryllotalpicola ginsengisoli]
MTLQLTPDLRADTRRAVADHLSGLAALAAELERHQDRIAAWADELAARLDDRRRLLVAGNGGSAAEAQHLAAELVGRFAAERRAFSAIALTAETSSLTALGNDYGYERVFARQVEAHARPGDVLLLLSTSGRSPNLLLAADAARSIGVTTWALTGTGPTPLAQACDDAIELSNPAPHAQEGHLIAIHALCCAFDAAIARADAACAELARADLARARRTRPDERRPR